ncbi:MAG: MFS transporter [Nitriliruptorales bacterium]|nr:MFS transporter [Nitriliruptorales bacterium]
MWSNSNIRRLALARLISSTGGEAAFFVGIWGRAAFDFDATPSQLAVMMGALGVLSLAGAATAGVLVDRFGPRRVLIGAEIVFAPAALALILPSSMSELTVAVGVVGLVGSVVSTAVMSFPPYITSDEQLLGKTNAAMETASTGAFVAGPAVGALLARFAGLDWIFVVDALTSIVGVGLIIGVATNAVPEHERHSAVRELREGFRFAYRLPRVRFLLMLAMVTWLSFGTFSALEPIFYREVLGTGPAAIGVVNAIFGVGLALGATLMGRYARRLVTVRNATILTAAAGAGAVAYSGTSSLVIVSAGGFAWGLILGALLPVMRTLLQAVTPGYLQGRVMGVWSTNNTVGEMLPLLMVPALAAAAGVQAVLVGSGLLVFVTGMLCIPKAGSIDRRGIAVPEPRADVAAVAHEAPKRPFDPAVAEEVA